MSLASPHPIFTLAWNSPSRVVMASIQALMLSGRYRCDAILQKWSKRVTVYCILSQSCNDKKEDIDHILRICPALTPTCLKLFDYTRSYSEILPWDVSKILLSFCTPTNPQFCKFLLDCSVLPEVVRCIQIFGRDMLVHILNNTRTWTYVLHREQLKMCWALKRG